MKGWRCASSRGNHPDYFSLGCSEQDIMKTNSTQKKKNRLRHTCASSRGNHRLTKFHCSWTTVSFVLATQGCTWPAVGLVSRPQNDNCCRLQNCSVWSISAATYWFHLRYCCKTMSKKISLHDTTDVIQRRHVGFPLLYCMPQQTETIFLKTIRNHVLWLNSYQTI